MLTEDENAALTRVGRGSAMGQLFRQFWQPVVPSTVLEAGGSPMRVTILGEPLVAFRTPDGALGIVDEHCPHRCASLRLAWNERDGLRCIYHGWKITPNGEVIDTPTEPDSSVLRTRVRQPAYPCRDACGLIWVYMGDGAPPELPDLEFLGLPEDSVSTVLMREECNWAQCLEGVIDSAHSNYLHRQLILPEAKAVAAGGTVYNDDGYLERPSADGHPLIELADTPVGFRYGAIRSVLGSETGDRYVRTTHFVVPNIGIFPAPAGWGNLQFFVPIDNNSTMFFYVRYHLDGSTISADVRSMLEERSGLRQGLDILDGYIKTRNSQNVWLQDRARMREGESGIFGVQNEDAAVQESMGSVVDRTREHLGRTDRAIVHMRRIMLQAAQQLEATGTVPYRPGGAGVYSQVHAQDGIIPIDGDWSAIGRLQPA